MTSAAYPAQSRGAVPLGQRFLPWRGNGRGGQYHGRMPRYRGAAGTTKALPRSQRLTARRARPDGSTAIPTETVALSHRRTALPARHAMCLR